MWTRGASPGLSKTEISLSCEHVEHLLVCLKQRYHCHVNMWNPGVSQIKISRHVNTWKVWFVWNRDITVMWTHGTQECPKQTHHLMWTLETSPGLSETDITHESVSSDFNLVCLKQWHVMWTLGASRSGFSKTGTCHANTSQSGLSKTGTWTLEISALSETGTWTLETSALKQGHEHLKHLLRLKKGHEHFIYFL